MIRNYFKIAYRTIVRHKGYAAINITGLAIGITACLLLFLVVRHEMSYNSFFPGNEKVYRVVTETHDESGADYTPGVPFPALDALRIDFPQAKIGAIQAAPNAQITVPAGGKLPIDDKKFIEESSLYFADPQFFDVLKFNWLSGNPSVLTAPNNVVLTQQMAEKYFGDWHNALGKHLLLKNELLLKVSGILENNPSNTDFPLGIVISLITSKNNPKLFNYSTEWGSITSNFQVYMKIPQNQSPELINKQLEKFTAKNFKEENSRDKTLNYLQSINDIHYDSRFGSFGDHNTSKSTLITLSLIGVLIVVMACINFINLSTAQAIGRSKEIGVRKVLGSNRSQLFSQMMGETALIVLFSMLLAIGISWLALPYLAQIIKLPADVKLFTPLNSAFLVSVSLLVTLLSGIYPALILSGFKPVLALKSKINSATIGGISLRRALVVSQFVISQILIVGTIVAISQMSFIRNADLGFNKQAILVLASTTDSVIVSRQKAFKDELLKIPGVEEVSYCTDVPSSEMNWGANFAYNGKEDEPFAVFIKFADEDYIKTFGLKLAAGRNFAQSDTIKEFLINETLMHRLGINDPNKIIGQFISLGGRDLKPIVGVVKDFKVNSLRESVKPLLISSWQKRYRNTIVKFNTAEISKTKIAVEKRWNDFYPEYAFTSTFFDENIAQFYRQEEQLAMLYKIFSGLAIFISCLGLYGLVSFMAMQKTKEVGVRKVLGASIGNIVYLFSKEFTVLIALAFLIASPIAYMVMNHWLSNFAYRINIGFTVFLLAIGISLCVAWITVGYKAVKAALANPVKSLRNE